MKPPTTLMRTLFVTLFFCFVLQSFSQTTILSYNSSWKYLDTDTRPAGWETTGYSDAGWSSGNAELGYGDGDETTMVSYGPSSGNKYISTYFRAIVNVADPSSFTDFTFNLIRDDGAVVYVNGSEVIRSNMPGGAISHSTLASSNISGAAESAANAFTVATSYFVSGNNTIAVEIHQDQASSSDLSFNLQIQGNVLPVTLINYTDSWKYLDDGSDQGTTWKNIGFSDAGWPSGAAELGYGDGGEATTVSYGPDANNKYITTYFRKTFTITGLATYSGFTLNVIRDDGMVVYINGVEVARDNLPAGTITYTTLAPAAIGGADETTPVSYSLSTCYFTEGANTIAVEMHQNAGNSSDLSFSLELDGNPSSGSTPSLTRGPYLQMGNETALTFRWRTDVSCYGRVRVGPSVGNYTTANLDETCPTTEHEIRITGLTADTKYFYEISSTDGTVLEGDADNFFTTAPPANTTRTLRFTIFGDCGRGDVTYQNQTYSQYQNYLTTNGIDAPDAWLLLGDNAYNSGTDIEYTSNFFNIYDAILKNHKLYPTPGNHDYANSGSRQDDHNVPYYSIFSLPTGGEAGGVASGKEEFYSYDIGNVHFLALDAYGEESNMRLYDTLGAQAVWVKNDLAANTKKWTIAYWHHPPYTKGSHNSDSEGELIDMRTNFIRILERYGVDLIICGHSHDYERSYLLKGHYGLESSFNAGTHAISTSSADYQSGANCPYVYNSTPLEHGTVYVVAGSTGASGGTQSGYPHDALPFSVNDGGMFMLEVDSTRLNAKFLRRTGVIYDQFTIMKDVNRDQTFNITEGNPVTLTASWPGDYNWNTAETTSSITVTPSLGTHNYTVTDDFGCVTDQFEVNVLAALPVNLVDYKAALNAGKVDISWATATESGSKEFIVERSSNTRDFEIVGKLNAAGESSSRKEYSLTDHHPIAGVSYYRLSQTDLNGGIKYYDLKRIVNSRSIDVRWLRSDANSLVLQINSAKDDKISLRVFDLSGKEIWSENMRIYPGSINKKIQLMAGSYIWEIKNSAGESVSQVAIIK